MPAKHQTRVTNSMGHSASSINPPCYTTRFPIVPGHRSQATPTKHFPGTGKWLHCDLYGKTFATSDECHAAMQEHGYTEWSVRRRSIPLETFKSLDFVQQECRFDALYRLWKWKGRQPGTMEDVLRHFELLDELKHLAKKVGLRHPVAHAWTSKHLRSDIKVS